jgi:putative transposase
MCDGYGKPLVMLLTEGQMSDHKGARLILGRIATRCDRSAHAIFSTICFAAAIVFGL